MSKTAIIVLDLQNALLKHLGDKAADYLSRVSSTLDAARAAGVHVIYIKTCFRPGHPDISSRNFTAQKIGSYGGFVDGDPVVEIPPKVAPKEHDIVVIKRRVSAFAGSDLDCVLRGLNVDSLVLLGIATSGAVLSTCRAAADLDFSLTVLGDLCFDFDEEVHRVLVEKVFPRQAHTMNAKEWVDGLSPSAK